MSRRRWVSWHQEYPHHTAIVSEVRDGGKLVVVLHQNVGGDGTSVEDLAAAELAVASARRAGAGTEVEL